MRDAGHAERDRVALPDPACLPGRQACVEAGAAALDLHVGAVAQQFDGLHGAAERAVSHGRERVGADADRRTCAGERGARRQGDAPSGPAQRERVAIALDLALDDVHGRRADEPGDEAVHRAVVELGRRAHLLHDAVLHDHDAVGQAHGLFLVVGHVHHRRTKATVEEAELRAHLATELRIEVRERLVEQEDRRVAHDRPADRDALALAAGEFTRHAVQQGLQPQQVRGAVDPPGDPFGLRPVQRAVGRTEQCTHAAAVRTAALEPEGHVPPHRHVRVEGVVLEDHGDVAVARRDVVHDPPADGHRALADLLEPRDHAQRGALAAARRADEHDELAVPHVQVDALHRAHAAGIDLADRLEDDLCHECLSCQPLTAPRASPSTNCRCAAMKRRMQGSMVTRLAAMSRCTSSRPPYWFRKLLSATASVACSSACR